jgi:hypothetical protein
VKEGGDDRIQINNREKRELWTLNSLKDKEEFRK